MARIHDDAEKDYMLGMKYKDIARKYGVTISTVKSWKTRYKWNRVEPTHTNQKKSTQKKKVRNPKSNKQVAVIRDEDHLTEKQRLFCLYFIKNRNATQAAIKAGYSKDTAGVIGYENLTKPHVRAEVERLKAIKLQSIMLTEDDIVERYMQIGLSDMTDVVEWGTELVPDLTSNGGLQIDSFGNIKMKKRDYFVLKNSDQVDGGLIREIGQGPNGLKIKLEDRIKALQWLSDYFNMNPMNKHKQRYDQEKLRLDRESLEHRKEMDKKNNW